MEDNNIVDRSDFDRDMAFLKRPSPISGQTLYDHLCEIVRYMLEHKDSTSVSTFEECSRLLRPHKAVEGIRVDETNCEYALRVRDALQGVAEHAECAGVGSLGADVLETLKLGKCCGVALDPEETLLVAAAANRLTQKQAYCKVRFWGKVLGRSQDYLVVQAELTDDEMDRRSDLLGSVEQAALEDPLNRKVYLTLQHGAADVTTAPGPRLGCKLRELRELPPIRSQHVRAARALDGRGLLLTGLPDAEVAAFPGTEAEFLHTQLVRIAAACTVSPLGAFARPGHHDLAAEDEWGLVLNRDWPGVPAGEALAELAEPALGGWVHAAPCLQSSGRLAPPALLEDSDEEAAGSEGTEEDGGEEQGEEADDLEEDDDSLQSGGGDATDEAEGGETEVGQDGAPEPLLAPVGQDAPLPAQRCPAWTARVCSPLLSEAVVLRSNRWPGAIAYCSGRTFGNLYFGWGQKAAAGRAEPSMADEEVA